MRIAIDIDSTLHHYWDQFAAAAKRRFGVELLYDGQVTWGLSQLRPEQVRAVVEETHRETNVLAAEPYPHAVEAVRRWHADGHWILITSHRAEACHAYTTRWLEDIGLPFDLLHCSYAKVPHCVEMGVGLLIDDSPVNIADALEAGMAVATIVHPWNADLCETEEVYCAHDWHGLERALVPLLGSEQRGEGAGGGSTRAA